MPTLQEIKKRQQYITKANQTEEKYGLPRNLLVGVMGAESNFNPNAVSPVGAKGLMQFMKATAQEYNINPLNPSESIDAAGKYLASSYKKFGNWEDSLRSYNMGVGGLQKVKAGKMKMPKETQDYVGRVYKNAGINYGSPEDATYANSVAPYMNQQKETVTASIHNFDFLPQTTTFASVPDSVEKEETKTEEDKDVAEVEQKTKEFNFLDELTTTAAAFKLREKQQIEAPQTDYMQQYEQISQFVENPQVAQQGRKFKLQDERNLVQRDATQVNTQKFRPLQQLNVRNKTDKEIAQEREAKIQASVEAQKVPYTKENWRQQLAAETSATGDKLRVSNEPNFFDDYINPAVMIGSMASNLGQAPLQAQQSDSVMPYVTAIGAPIATGALTGIGAKTTGQFVNNVVNPLAGTGELIDNLGNKYLPNAYKYNPLAFKPKSEAYYRQVFGEEALKSPIITRSMQANNDPKGIAALWVDAIPQQIEMPNGQINDYLQLSHTSSSSNDALPYFNKSRPYYSDNFFKGKPKETLIETNFPAKDYEDFYPASMRDVSINPSQIANDAKMFGDVRVLNPFSKEGHNLENYNIYKKDWLQGYKQVPQFQQGGQQKFTENELAFLSEIAIKDNNGQWTNPGKITEIQGENITMKNVPYSLLGVADTGEQKIMSPEKTYRFKGAKKVVEIPFFKK